MTRKEMVQKNDPGYVNEFGVGGVEGCPADYPYLDCTDVICGSCGGCDDVTCAACWNQEYNPASVTEKFEVEEFLDRNAVIDLIEHKLKTLDGDAFNAVREVLTKVSMLRIFEIEEFQMLDTN